MTQSGYHPLINIFNAAPPIERISLPTAPPAQKLRRKRDNRTGLVSLLCHLPNRYFCCSLSAGAPEPRGDNLVLGRVPLVIVLAAGLSGCAEAFVYGGGDDVRIHYARFGVTPPQGNTVTVCHAYTCKMQTPYTFSQKDLAEIRTVMAKTKRADTPYEERRAVAYAIAFIDVKVGNKLGIHDKAGMQFSATGDPTQEDCVDVSTNTTSYLLVMQANGMLKHHTVDATMSKANLGKGLAELNPVKYWPHWSAILKENESGQKYAVDRWPFDQGENAAVVKVEDWNIKDRE